MSGHERWSDDVAAYMLGALEPDETAELERHLERCDLCREQVRWLGPAVRALPEGVERVEPPSQLRQRLFAEAGLRPRSSRAAAGVGARARSWARRFGPSGRGWRPAAAAATATVAMVLLVVIAFEIGSNGGTDFVPEPTTVSGEGAGGIAAEVVREGPRGTVRLDNVPQPSGNKVLAAWVQRGEAVEPVPALFVPDSQGRAWTTIEDMEGVEKVMVTEEPRGGSEAPTAAPLLEVEIPG